MDVRSRHPRLLALLGSGEFEPWAAEVDRRLLEHGTGSGGVLLFATASAPDGEPVYSAWLRKGSDHYASLGVPVAVADVRTREDARDPAVAGAVAAASLIFFSGGNPAYLATVVRDTPLWSAIAEALERGAAFAGCSAGACLAGDLAPESVTADADAVRWVPALGMLPGTLVVPHWDVLDVYRPGQRTALVNGHARGRTVLGIDEFTAAVIADGVWRVAGEGQVLVQRDVRWRRFSSGAPFDPDAALDHPGPLYHRTFEAARIMRDGFTDTVEERPGGGTARGVWLSDRPLDDEDEIRGDSVLAVEIPYEVAAEFEWTDGGDRYREFCIPAAIVNRSAPFVLVDPRTGPAMNLLPAETG
ncbi:MAG TPA: Type 1 glutamine amidotransferase-like domain-containing protein [Actinomycetota bacterium]|nr:Type 1 glutamine amidotransferase-like domain-containing protein [Actinomycetota bacterium]